MPHLISAAHHGVSQPRLPFWQIYQLIEDVGPLIRIGRPRLAAFLRMMRNTSPRDWTDPRRVPVCFMQQQDLADTLGITPRALRQHEVALRDLGLITIDTGSNGRRSGRPLSDGRRLGINFAPLLERVAQLLELREAAQARLMRLRQLRLECSAARRAVRDLLCADLDLSAAALAEIEDRKALWPERYTQFRTPAALTVLLNDILSVEKQLMAARRKDETSATAAAFLPAVQNTDSIEKGICTDTGEEKADAYLHRPVQTTAENVPTAPPAPTFDLSAVTVNEVLAIASDDFRFILDYKAKSPSIAMPDLRAAAIELALHLGISPSVYEEAAEAMGDLGAVFSVISIDHGTRRQESPIRSPGAAMRSYARLTREGRFNLTGMLSAMRRRTAAHLLRRP